MRLNYEGEGLLTTHSSLFILLKDKIIVAAETALQCTTNYRYIWGCYGWVATHFICMRRLNADDENL